MDVNASTIDLNPTVWGPSVWNALHVMALRADDAASRGEAYGAFPQLLGALTDLIPCSICRAHFAAHIKQHGVPQPGEAFAWTVAIHNIVNEVLGKGRQYDVEEARAFWLNNGCSSSCNSGGAAVGATAAGTAGTATAAGADAAGTATAAGAAAAGTAAGTTRPLRIVLVTTLTMVIIAAIAVAWRARKPQVRSVVRLPA